MLAHALLEPSRLGVSPLVVALLAWAVTVAVARLWTPGRPAPEAPGGRDGQVGPRSPVAAQPIDRGWRSHVATVVVLAVGLLGLGGGPTQLTNPITPLVVGVGLPGLVLVAAMGADVAGRWNAFAAPSTRSLLGHLDHRLVVVAAVIGGGWLALVPAASDPRPLAWFVLGWTVGSILLDAVTGGRWVEQAEPLTRVLRWLASLRGARGADDLAAPAPGVFAVLTGVLLAGAARITEALPQGLGIADELLAIVVAGAVAVVIHHVVAEAGRVVPLATIFVGAVVAVALVGNRATTSLQLLAVHASDPLRQGWDLLGTAGLEVDPTFPDPALRTVAQILIVLGAAAVAGRRFPAPTRTVARSDALLVALTLLVVTVR